MNRLILTGRQSVTLAAVLGIVMTLVVLYGAIHHRPESETRIDPCALVLTLEHGPVCR